MRVAAVEKIELMAAPEALGPAAAGSFQFEQQFALLVVARQALHPANGPITHPGAHELHPMQ